MSKQRSNWFAACLVICLVVLIGWEAYAEIPHKINYQGKIRDAITGNPLAGSHNMTFRILDAASGGTVLWSESQTVAVDTSGVYSVILGSVSEISISFDSPRWLEIDVDGEILSPRREIVGAASAFNAMNADNLDGYDSSQFAGSAHAHDSRYFTQAQLTTTDGTPPNQGSNLVHWNLLNGVPAGFADGNDNVGPGDGYSLDAADGLPMDVVYVDDAGDVGIGTVSPDAKLEVAGSGVGIMARAAASSGVGILAEGGNQTSGTFVAGSGVVGQGPQCGVSGYAGAGGNNGQCAFFGQAYNLGEVRVCYRATSGIHYKILGDGLASSVMSTSDGRVALACPESPEAWLEDYGSGEIKFGACHVDLDPLLLQCITVNQEHPLKVFVQLTSALVNQFYVEKGQRGFDVVVVGEGAENSSATFDYKVVGKWKGNEDFRFEKVEESPASMMRSEPAQY